MTTANVHSLTHGATQRATKSVIAKPAMAVAKMQRMMMAFSLAGWLIQIQRIRHNYRTRRELAALSPRLLADIGMTEAQRQAELRKPFWKNERQGR